MICVDAIQGSSGTFERAEEAHWKGLTSLNREFVQF